MPENPGNRKNAVQEKAVLSTKSGSLRRAANEKRLKKRRPRKEPPFATNTPGL